MNKKYMDLAIKQAEVAMMDNEIPIGCVIVKNNEIIAIAHNEKEKSNMVTRHAEIIAIEEASKKIGNWRLLNCDIYITLEPCPMCASAIKQARISNVYCGLSNSDSKNLTIITQIFEKDNTNPNVNFYNNLAVDKVRQVMQSFFEKQRKK